MRKFLFILFLLSAAALAVVRAVPARVVWCCGGSGGNPDFCLVNTSNIDFYFRLDDAAGGPWVDATGQLASLTAAGATQIKSYLGKITNAAGFDNAKTQYCVGPTSGSCTLSNNDTTLTCWVYLTNKTTSQAFLSKDTFSTTQSGYVIDYDTGTDRFRFRAGGTNGMSVPQTVSVTSTNGGSPSINTWYFLCAQFCRASNYIAISVNDSGLDKINYPSTIAPQVNTSTLRIGAMTTHLPPYAAEATIGMIDEVGKWGRLLLTNEVTCLYHSGAPTKFQTYPFN